MQAHRLRREIISTNLANAMINRGGPACVVRLIDETGADVPTIVTALVAVDESYGLKRLNDAIDGLDTRIDGQVQLGLYAADSGSAALPHGLVCAQCRFNGRAGRGHLALRPGIRRDRRRTRQDPAGGLAGRAQQAAAGPDR